MLFTYHSSTHLFSTKPLESDYIHIIYDIPSLFKCYAEKNGGIFMKKLKKRPNGKGSAVCLGDNRYKPWTARITIGKDIKGNPIYYDIDTFETQLDTLVCLENYHK